MSKFPTYFVDASYYEVYTRQVLKHTILTLQVLSMCNSYMLYVICHLLPVCLYTLAKQTVVGSFVLERQVYVVT
jgi:hypothetical protein